MSSRERETPVTSIDITLKSRVIMHMITSKARGPYASTRSELSSARVHVKTRSLALDLGARAAGSSDQ